MTRSSIDDPLVRCKIDGCTETAKSRFGPFGGLCETHRAARLAERRAGENGKTGRAPLRTALTPMGLDYEFVVNQALIQIDDAIVAAEKQVGQMLRDEIAARLIPRKGEAE